MKTQNCYDNFNLKNQCIRPVPEKSVYTSTSLYTSDPMLLELEDFFTHSGVSSLVKFLCNGLVRGHDNKRLDGHVEGGHGDQVGHIVSVERKKKEWLSVNGEQWKTQRHLQLA